MRWHLRLASLAALSLVTAWAAPGCSSDEGAAGKMDGGAMDKDKMGGGPMDKDKMGGMDSGKMGGPMDKDKMGGGAMEKDKMEGAPK